MLPRELIKRVVIVHVLIIINSAHIYMLYMYMYLCMITCRYIVQNLQNYPIKFTRCSIYKIPENDERNLFTLKNSKA